MRGPIARLKRWADPQYRIAHSFELPTRQDCLALCLVVVALLAAGHIVWTQTLRAQALEAEAMRQQILASCSSDGRVPFGYEKDIAGRVWALGCTVVMRRT